MKFNIFSIIVVISLALNCFARKMDDSDATVKATIELKSAVKSSAAPDELCKKYPALASWNLLVNAIQKNDWNQAMRYVCDERANGKLVIVDFKAIEDAGDADDLLKTNEFASIGARIPLEFGEVEHLSEKEFRIRVKWGISKVTRENLIAFYRFYVHSKNKVVRNEASKQISKLEKMKDIQFLEARLKKQLDILQFHRIAGVWRLLPKGW